MARWESALGSGRGHTGVRGVDDLALDLTSESKEQEVSRLVTLRSRRILRYKIEDSAYQQRSGSHLRPRKTREIVCC